MEQIKKILRERENQLQQLKKAKEKALVKAPEGSLRLCKHGNKTQYYYRNDPKDFNGVYIKEKDIENSEEEEINRRHIIASKILAWIPIVLIIIVILCCILSSFISF